MLFLVVYVFLVEEPTVSNKSLNGSNSNYMLRLYSLHGSRWEVAGLNPVSTGVTTMCGGRVHVYKIKSKPTEIKQINEKQTEPTKS